MCRKGASCSVAISELLELLFEKYLYNKGTALEDRMLSRSRGEDSISEHVFRVHLNENGWSHTCGGYDDGDSQGGNVECR